MTQYPINVSNRNRGDTGGFIAYCAVLLTFVLVYLFFSLCYMRVYIVGSSMEDTLAGAVSEARAGGDFIYAYKYISLERGDIVVIDEGDKNIIKRIIALGGDTVELRGGQLYLNGRLTEEPYVLPEHNDPDYEYNNMSVVTVPEGTVFCMGDNRNVSVDSRNKYGCIDESKVLGIVADWSMTYKSQVTAINTFFEFTLPSWFGK